MTTKFDTRQTIHRPSLTQLTGASASQLKDIVTATDAQLAKLFEDRNFFLSDGGQIALDVNGTSLSFTENLKLQFNSRVAGGSPQVIDLGAGPYTFSATGRMAYAVINRTAGTATVTQDSATLPAVTSANLEVVLLAKRVDTAASIKTVYLLGGTSVRSTGSTRIGRPTANNVEATVALPMWGNAANADVMAALQLADAETAKLVEDRNIFLADGGQISLNAGGTSVTITENLKLHVNSLVAGGAPSVIDLGAGPFTFTANGRMLYAVINRTAATATVTADAATLPSVVAANIEVVLLAKRIDSPASVKTVYFRNGTSVSGSGTTRLGRATTTNIETITALPLLGTAANATADSAMIAADADLAKLYEDRNATLVNGGFITYLGTTVQFTEALELHINSKIAGGAPVVVSLAATTRTISASGRMIYAVVNRTAGTAVVTDDAATLPTVVAANTEVWLIAKRVDAADGTKRLNFRNGSSYNDGQSARLGSAGSGSGSYARIFINQ